MGQNSSKSNSEPPSSNRRNSKTSSGSNKGETQKHSKGPASTLDVNGNANNYSPGHSKKRMSFYETVDASEILPYLIIGNLASSKNPEFLSRKNVKYILNLTTEAEEIEDIECRNIPLEDDDDQELLPHLTSSFEFINQAAKTWPTSGTIQKKDKAENEKATVLVHSYFGMSRSSAVIIAYLMKEKNWNLKDAYQHLKERHSSVNPNDNFVVQLIRYEQELFDGKMSMTVKDFH